MKSNVYNLRNEARAERQRQSLAAGLLSDHFPGVTSIVVTMNYGRGTYSALLRTLNFYPGNPAYFRISCLGDGCESGALDLTKPIHTMVRNRATSSKGVLTCDNKDAAVTHPRVEYQVTITYG